MSDLKEVTIRVNVAFRDGKNPDGEQELVAIKFVDFPTRLDVAHFVDPNSKEKRTVADLIYEELGYYILSEYEKQNRQTRDFD